MIPCKSLQHSSNEAINTQLMDTFNINCNIDRKMYLILNLMMYLNFNDEKTLTGFIKVG